MLWTSGFQKLWVGFTNALKMRFARSIFLLDFCVCTLVLRHLGSVLLKSTLITKFQGKLQEVCGKIRSNPISVLRYVSLVWIVLENWSFISYSLMCNVCTFRCDTNGTCWYSSNTMHWSYAVIFYRLYRDKILEFGNKLVWLIWTHLNRHSGNLQISGCFPFLVRSPKLN